MRVHLSIVRAIVLSIIIILATYSYRCWSALEEHRPFSVDSLRALRPIRARLTGFSYAPLMKKEISGSLRAAMRREERRILRTPNNLEPAALRSRALLRIIDGKFSDAIGLLEQASERAPQDPTILSDLAATYVARAEEKADPYDLLRALSVCDRALKLEPTLLAAMFNKALILNNLYLFSQEGLAWSNYMKRDSGSKWRSEAVLYARKSHLDSLAQWTTQREYLRQASLRGDIHKVSSIVHRFPQAAREWAEESLLVEWAESDSLDLSIEPLVIARAIGKSLAELNGDSMLLEEVSVIDQCLAVYTYCKVGNIRRGYLLFCEGIARVKDRRFEEALGFLQDAAVRLASARSPLKHWADLYVGICLYQRPQYERAYRIVKNVSDRSSQYPSLRARALWIMGLTQFVTGNPAGALSIYKESSEIFLRIRETDNFASLQRLIAENLYHMGDVRHSWEYRIRALSLAPSLMDSRKIYAIFAEAAYAATSERDKSMPLDFYGELISRAEKLEEKDALVESLMRRSFIYKDLNFYTEARKDIESAKKLLPSIKDPNVRRRDHVDILIAEVELVGGKNFRETTDMISNAIDYYSRSGRDLEVLRLLSARASLYVGAGSLSLAANDFLGAMRLINIIRRKIVDPDLGLKFSDEVADIIDNLVKFEVSRGNPGRALSYLEQSRARSLFEEVSPATERNASLRDISLVAAIKKNLPEDMAVVDYTLIGERIFIWVVTRERLRFIESNVSTEDLQDRINILAGSLHNSSRFVRSAQDLYDVLVRPIASTLSSTKRIVFVPEGVLWNVPFSALYNRVSKRFLLDDFCVAVSPSALFVAHVKPKKLSLAEPRLQSALIFANPAFDRSRYPGFNLLPAAEMEARAIQKIYGNGSLLVSSYATREKFVLEAPNSVVIHLAAHSIINDMHPLLGGFLVAPDRRGGKGFFSLRDLYGLCLRRTRLVVLASCGSGVGPTSRSEGALSAARAFLITGAQAVVASIWDVNDSRTSRLVEDFHNAFHGGEEVSSALRTAQLAYRDRSLASGDGDYSWGGFQVFGVEFN